ncbi:hypothetical protein [Photobacterium damselae]|uniref:hypothetical protein n=1 Tax=Photobacterium damselae TaxID=38293 RepID=UPI0040693A76
MIYKKQQILTDDQFRLLRQTLNRANGVFVVLGSGFKMNDSCLTYSENQELMGLHSNQIEVQKDAWKNVWNKTTRTPTHPFLIAYPAWMRTSPLPASVQPLFHVFKSSVMDCVSEVTGSNVNLFELNGNISVGMSQIDNVEQKVSSLSDIDSLIPLFPIEKEKYQCRKKTVGRFEMTVEHFSVNNFLFLGCSSQNEIHASFFNRALNKSIHDKINIVTANTNNDNFMIEHSTMGFCCDAKAFLDELHERLLNDNPNDEDSYMNVCKKLGLCS